MIYFAAPHAAPQMMIRLPKSVPGNTEENQSDVLVQFRMNGGYSTFVKTNDQRIIRQAFEIEIEKQQEVQEFFKKVAQEKLRMITDDGSFVCDLLSPVITFRNLGKTSSTFELELEGYWL